MKIMDCGAVFILVVRQTCEPQSHKTERECRSTSEQQREQWDGNGGEERG